jgi:hypothetical protein
MMNGLCLNPSLGLVVRIFIEECYFEKPKLIDENCYMILEQFYQWISH